MKNFWNFLRSKVFLFNIGLAFLVIVVLSILALQWLNKSTKHGEFVEVPAKWTGNGSRLSQPHENDWYETVKINYGLRPDGTKDFEELPEGFANKDHKAHFEFWKAKTVPDSWIKFRDIAFCSPIVILSPPIKVLLNYCF